MLEVFSPPPKVSFSWRHFGKLTGDFAGAPATNEIVEMYGHCVAVVDENLVIKSLDVSAC